MPDLSLATVEDIPPEHLKRLKGYILSRFNSEQANVITESQVAIPLETRRYTYIHTHNLSLSLSRARAIYTDFGKSCVFEADFTLQISELSNQQIQNLFDGKLSKIDENTLETLSRRMNEEEESCSDDSEQSTCSEFRAKVDRVSCTIRFGY